jgi:hypothetical protein
MTLSDLAAIGQVVSAVVILASLVFLAVQVRSNTRELRSQSYFNGLTHGQRPFELLIQDPSLMRIVNRGYRSPDALEGDDKERFRLHTFMLFNAWEYFFYQYKDGSIPKQLFLGTDTHMRMLVTTRPGVAGFWAEYRHAYAEPFLSYATSAFPKETHS